MTQTLREFIQAREAAIKQQQASLRRELDELRAAKAAIDGGATTPAQEPKVTHRAMVREVLDEHPEGGTSEQVIGWVREKYGVEISRTSISSHLSRIKSEEGGALFDSGSKRWWSTKHRNMAEVLSMGDLGLTPSENEVPAGSSDADAEDSDQSSASPS